DYYCQVWDSSSGFWVF
nr:immunoglobulin light chain junction region [Macaca mulatta]MOX17846.1 immunoglobulin light chain junction region [Macaca mulatta]MOX18124.1 immunoglobulin light chain junction region [Macaca mulatta]MOX18867.1 immunoglobulin light chain junction region [Macaca mulatta]MOX19671.1 immunoglobulin light chain junction region [Macaca mulatta]